MPRRPIRIENGLIFIPLTRGLEAFTDDTPEIRQIVLSRSWQASPKGYAVDGSVRLHRLLLPGHEIVDHANNNKLDNRMCNLRPASLSQNAMNCRPHRGRTLKGAYKRRCGVRTIFVSYIKIDGKSVHLGRFATEMEAHEAWMAAAIKRDPHFARGGLETPDTH
jgi:hypothetical protein